MNLTSLGGMLSNIFFNAVAWHTMLSEAWYVLQTPSPIAKKDALQTKTGLITRTKCLGLFGYGFVSIVGLASSSDSASPSAIIVVMRSACALFEVPKQRGKGKGA